MALTRFYDRASDRDGPTTGALQVMPIYIGDMLTNVSVRHSWKPPAGAAFCVVSAHVRAAAVSQVMTLRIGSAVDGQQIVADKVVTTNTDTVTVITAASANVVTSGNTLSVRLTSGTTGTATGLYVNLVGYMCAPPNSEKHPNR